MADSTSDSGSVQSFQAEQQCNTNEKKNSSRFYALYSFYPKRLQPAEGTVHGENSEPEEGSLSLNIVATNLAAATETELRKTLALKIAKKVNRLDEGNFFSVGLSSSADALASASCYYSMVQTTSDSLGFDHVTADEKNEASSSSDAQQFVICFISFKDGSLDLFQTELNQYSQGLIPMLDKEAPPLTPPSASSTDTSNNADPPSSAAQPRELSQLSTGIISYLEQWPVVVLDYLTRAIQYLGTDIQQLLYASLLNASLQISGATPEQEDDIKRFFRCCSLSSLLDQLQPDKTSVFDSSDSNDLWQLQPIIVTLTFQQGQGVTFNKSYSCQFCRNASEKLLTFDPTNVTKVREFLDSIKLAFAHNLNKLKRFLKQAELDHYALYRAFSYLKKCGCGDLLMRYVKLEGGNETLNVLAALETYIKDRKQVLA